MAVRITYMDMMNMKPFVPHKYTKLLMSRLQPKHQYHWKDYNCDFYWYSSDAQIEMFWNATRSYAEQEHNWIIPCLRLILWVPDNNAHPLSESCLLYKCQLSLIPIFKPLPLNVNCLLIEIMPYPRLTLRVPANSPCPSLLSWPEYFIYTK